MNKKIGIFGAVSTGVGMLIATSCFISSASGASAVGTPFVIAIIIACIANMMAVLSIAELNAIMPNLTGGIAQYTLAGLGPLITIVTMVGGYLISNVFAAPAEGAMFAGVMTEISGDSIPPAVFSVGITIILIIINLKGVNMSTFLQEIVASFMVVSLIILSIIGAFGIGTGTKVDQASVISSDLAMELKDTDILQLGRAKQVKVQKENTIIVDGMGDKTQIDNRVAQLKAQIAEEKSSFEKENLQERLAKIAGGVAVIGVGAATEVEMKDRKLRIEDALSATKAAVEEGIVAGGGTAYINIIPKVDAAVKELKEDERLGGNIVLKALEEPIRQIVTNAGLEPAVVVEKVKSSTEGFGFDAGKEEYVDMKKVGIVDPTKVTRSALQNAASIASMVLTTESIVTDKKEEKCGCGGHDSGMGAGMDGMY